MCVCLTMGEGVVVYTARPLDMVVLVSPCVGMGERAGEGSKVFVCRSKEGRLSV